MNLKRWIYSYHPLRGGWLFPDDASHVGHRDFRALPLTSLKTLWIPLAQGDESPATPRVKSGDHVKAWDVLAETVSGVRIHAPLRGDVRGVIAVRTAYADSVPAIELEVDTSHEELPAELLEGQIEDPPDSRAAFLSRMHEAGLALSALMPFADGKPPCAVIVTGLDVSPPQSCLTQMLFRYGPTIIEAATLIHKLFAVRRTYLAVDRAHRILVRLCQSRTHRTPVRVAPLANKYPQAVGVLLVRTILGHRIAPGGSPADVGVAVLGVNELVDVARALRGEPVTHRMVSIAGPSLSASGNYRVPVGASVGDILTAVGGVTSRDRVVFDCVLAGPVAEDGEAVITKRTSAVICVPPAREPEPIACIRCGICQDACPVQLDPWVLHKSANGRGGQAARKQNANACVACGLCDYLCPSDLPLMESVLQCRKTPESIG